MIPDLDVRDYWLLAKACIAFAVQFAGCFVCWRLRAGRRP